MRSLLACIALAAVALTGLAWWSLERGAPRVEADRPPVVPTQGETVLRATAPDVELPGEVTTRAPAIATTLAADAAEDEFFLEVVDGTSEAPLADTEVRYEVCKRGQARMEGDCVFDALSKGGSSTRTDARGIARLGVPDRMAVRVLARRPGLLGEAVFVVREGGTARPLRERLVLLPDWDLPVEVVDDALRPVADVPVICGVSDWSATQTTDASGRIVFRHAGYELARRPPHELGLSVDLPLRESAGTVVQHEPPRGEAVRLRLPSMGSVEVRVLEADGSPAEDGTLVELKGSGRQTQRDTADGRASFEHVGLGLELELTADRAAVSERAHAFFAGPRSPGERVTRTVQLAVERTVLTFRAVDELGQAIHGELQVFVGIQSLALGTGEESTVSTDAQGRFQIEVQPLVEGDRRELEVTSRHGALVGRVDLGRAFPPGQIDMGDIVLAAPPLIAAGRVVDEAGQAVARAQVSAAAVPGEGAEGRELDPFGRLEVTSDVEGAFALRGSVNARRVRLLLAHSQLGAEPCDVLVGSSGIEIVARQTGGVEGGLLIDPGLPQGALHVTLRPEEGGADTDNSPDVRDQPVRAAHASFRFQKLLPGNYRLDVRSGRELLAAFDHIVVRAREISRDPRIQSIDLTGRLNVFSLQLVPPSEPFTPSGSVTYTSAVALEPQNRFDLDGANPVLIVTSLPRIDAILRVDGCRIESLKDLAEHTEVRLRPGYAVRLLLPDELQLPAPPRFLGATLVSSQGAPSPAGGAQTFDERREILCLVSEPGRMSVRWFLQRRQGSVASWCHLRLPSEQSVEILGRADGEQRIVLQMTTEDLQAALATR